MGFEILLEIQAPSMLFGLFVLLACQLAGDILARALSLPVPGPVIGIILLVALLFLNQKLGRADADGGAAVEKSADGVLAYLGLVFVPAGAGIAQHFDLVIANGVPLAMAVIGSALATLVVTVWVFIAVRRLTTTAGDAR